MEQINGEGRFEYESNVRQRITFRVTEQFTVILNGAIVAPKKSIDRYAQLELNKDDKIQLITEGMFTIILVDLPSRGEVVSSDSMVEIIPEGEMSMYDRLRAEMMGVISKFADDKGMDSYDDANDFYLDDEDEPLIDTPYEYQAMMDEIPIDEPNSQSDSADAELKTNDSASGGQEESNPPTDSKDA